MPYFDSPYILQSMHTAKNPGSLSSVLFSSDFSLLIFSLYTLLTDLPARRFRLTVLRPLCVRILARKPLFRSFFILLVR